MERGSADLDEGLLAFTAVNIGEATAAVPFPVEFVRLSLDHLRHSYFKSCNIMFSHSFFS